ncbi:hypothetical protein V1278_000201 [Bradyrhizobium sp. AZCC 1577]
MAKAGTEKIGPGCASCGFQSRRDRQELPRASGTLLVDTRLTQARASFASMTPTPAHYHNTCVAWNDRKNRLAQPVHKGGSAAPKRVSLRNPIRAALPVSTSHIALKVE